MSMKVFRIVVVQLENYTRLYSKAGMSNTMSKTTMTTITIAIARTRFPGGRADAIKLGSRSSVT